MKADALLNAYIDLNLVVMAGALLWLSARTLMRRSAVARSYAPQLRILNGMTLLLALSPILMLLLGASGIGRPPTLSDVLVSQYLQGNVEISATRFEGFIGLREDIVRTLIAASTPWAQAVVILIVGGAVAAALQLGLAICRLHHAIDSAHPWKQIGRVELRLSDTANVAYSTRGLRTLYVIVPTYLLQHPNDLRLTLAHELQHFRQKDIETAFLLEALRPFLVWNPAYYLWRKDMRIVREFACDQSLAMQRRFDLRSYCECLIRAASHARGCSITVCERTPSVALLANREIRHSTLLCRRIDAVTAPRTLKRQELTWAAIFAVIGSAILGTALLIQRPADWSHDRIMLATIVNLERMAERNAAQASVAAINGDFVPMAH